MARNRKSELSSTTSHLLLDFERVVMDYCLLQRDPKANMNRLEAARISYVETKRKLRSHLFKVQESGRTKCSMVPRDVEDMEYE